MPPDQGLDVPQLFVVASAPVRVEGALLRLDTKFLTGMAYYCAHWPGRVTCLLLGVETDVPFGTMCRAEDLPFTLKILPNGHKIVAGDIEGADVLLCSGDSPSTFALAALMGENPGRLFYIIENILQTRLEIISLEPGVSVVRKLKRMLWALGDEIRRRRAFRRAGGLQANGAPAAAIYRQVNPNTMLFFDNRVRAEMMARQAEMDARRQRLLAGHPLRLVHSGRLEPLKGAQDIIPVVKALRQAGVPFTLDIFGTGSLEAAMREGMRKQGLQDQVRFHGVVDFETELVPFCKAQADIFLSCHRQSDPSCTYLESMGCGLAIAGYDNKMWRALQAETGAGWIAPMGRPLALAGQLISAASDPVETGRRCAAALTFARAHSFEDTFSRRIAHLLAGQA